MLKSVKEHDLVRILKDKTVEGILLPKGTIATVVSVYENGFAVEFPDFREILTFHYFDLLYKSSGGSSFSIYFL